MTSKTRRLFSQQTARYTWDVNRLRDITENINISGRIACNEPMAQHTSFRTGGPADIFAVPANEEDLRTLLGFARENKLETFVLGGGANILVADQGIRGLVIDTRDLKTIRVEGSDVIAGAGIPVSDISDFAQSRCLAGFGFIYSMPGSFGGAIWMNARCYGSEVGDVLVEVSYLDENFERRTMVPQRQDFKYKDTPFMRHNWTILEGRLRLAPGDPAEIRAHMEQCRADREAKGHFLAPCAGSIFKNNHDFGAPSGQLIDRAGLKGLRRGAAQVSPLHGNIIINTGGATSTEIRELVDEVAAEVERQFGFRLEAEVLMVGDWPAS